MNFFWSLHRVSKALFFAVGFAILVAFLFWKNNFYGFWAEVFLKIIDLPFAFVAIVFATTSFRLFLTENPEKMKFSVLDFFLFLAGFLLFLTVFGVDLFFKNEFSFPKIS